MASRDNTLFQICTTCKVHCCQNARPPLTKKRKDTIERYLAAHDVRIDHPFITTTYTFPRETQDALCVFFEQEHHTCLIHPVKPETCSAGPITFDINLYTGKLEWFLKIPDVCSLASILYTEKEALDTHLSHAKDEVHRLIHELPPEELYAILQIDEPDTVKLGDDSLTSEILEQQRRQHATSQLRTKEEN